MFCYKDRTFCNYYKDCANSKSCDRCLTEDILQEAEDLAMPIAMFADKPDCFVQTKINDEDDSCQKGVCCNVRR